MGRALAVPVAHVENFMLVHVGGLQPRPEEVDHLLFAEGVIEAKLLLIALRSAPSARRVRVKGNGDASEIVKRRAAELGSDGIQGAL